MGALSLEIGFEPGNVPRTAQQLAYEVVRRAILRGNLTPGTRLAQSEIAAQLALSTTPVREALRRLASDGLVRIDAHRGAIVRGVDVEELREIYEIRMLLEPLAMRKATMRITNEALDRAEALWQRMNHVTDLGDWAEDNRAFHAIFADAAASPTLIRILQGLRDSAANYVRWLAVADPDLPVRANQEHRQLLDACRARDADEAARIEEAHLLSTFQAMLDDFPEAGQDPG
ncbi:MAG TPA: GntR family transcriptional regulator [Nocardioidaceae bacterium]|nr:GntR family transcriptional regulator [Nocardioidaceae bacterium]